MEKELAVNLLETVAPAELTNGINKANPAEVYEIMVVDRSEITLTGQLVLWQYFLGSTVISTP